MLLFQELLIGLEELMPPSHTHDTVHFSAVYLLYLQNVDVIRRVNLVRIY